ncbi:MAG TPA: hypothetical protein VIF60_01105 [Burkholderiaceae bacterium]
MTQDQKKKVRNTLITAALFVLLLAPPHAGFMIIFFGLPLAIWIPVTLTKAFSRPESKAIQFTRVAIWVVAVCLVGVIHYARHVIVRNDANQIVAGIKAYRTKNGHYPETLSEIGISNEELKNRLGLSYYNSEKPNLSYAATFIVFDTYDFDFMKDAWEFRPD